MSSGPYAKCKAQLNGALAAITNASKWVSKPEALVSTLDECWKFIARAAEIIREKDSGLAGRLLTAGPSFDRAKDQILDAEKTKNWPNSSAPSTPVEPGNSNQYNASRDDSSNPYASKNVSKDPNVSLGPNSSINPSSGPGDMMASQQSKKPSQSAVTDTMIKATQQLIEQANKFYGKGPTDGSPQDQKAYSTFLNSVNYFANTVVPKNKSYLASSDPRIEVLSDLGKKLEEVKHNLTIGSESGF